MSGFSWFYKEHLLLVLNNSAFLSSKGMVLCNLKKKSILGTESSSVVVSGKSQLVPP